MSVLPKKTSYGEMFVQFIPGDPDAVAHETPPGALFRGSGEQAGKPHQGRTQFATVRQDHSESFLIGAYVDSACVKLNH